jgi:hypothetical protein
MPQVASIDETIGPAAMRSAEDTTGEFGASHILAPPLLESQIRNEIHAVDPSLPVFGIRSMNELMETSLAPHRFSAELAGAFAALVGLRWDFMDCLRGWLVSVRRRSAYESP